jgi:hypothetical protein
MNVKKIKIEILLYSKRELILQHQDNEEKKHGTH